MLMRETFEREVQRIVAQLIEHYQPEKIILFGSLARGEPQPTDIDLFIMKKNPPPLGAERVRELDRLIQYTIATDFIVYTPEETQRWLRLGDPFLKDIFTHGKVLYDHH